MSFFYFIRLIIIFYLIYFILQLYNYFNIIISKIQNKFLNFLIKNPKNLFCIYFYYILAINLLIRYFILWLTLTTFRYFVFSQIISIFIIILYFYKLLPFALMLLTWILYFDLLSTQTGSFFHKGGPLLANNLNSLPPFRNNRQVRKMFRATSILHSVGPKTLAVVVGGVVSTAIGFGIQEHNANQRNQANIDFQREEGIRNRDFQREESIRNREHIEKLHEKQDQKKGWFGR